MIVRFEHLALCARYIAYVVCFALYQAGEFSGHRNDLVVVTLAVFTHNAVVHYVLWQKRHAFFTSRWNFVLYLLEFSLIVQYTGAEKSDFAVLYLFLIGGYTLYSTHPNRIYTVTLLCLLAFSGVIFLEWWTVGIRLSAGSLFLKLASIPVTGWLTHTLAHPLRTAQDAVQKRSHALAASEAMMRAIFDATTHPIIVLDDRDTIIDVNQGATEVFGVLRQALLGKGLVSLFGASMAKKILTDVQLEGHSHGECQVSDPWECQHAIELEAHPFIRQEHRFLVIVMRDITQQRSLEKSSEQTQAKLAHLNLELVRMNEMKGQLVSELAQHIRTPLTAILGYLDMLLQDETGPITSEQQRALLLCRKSAAHIIDILDKTTTAPAIDSPQVSAGK